MAGKVEIYEITDGNEESHGKPSRTLEEHLTSFGGYLGTLTDPMFPEVTHKIDLTAFTGRDPLTRIGIRFEYGAEPEDWVRLTKVTGITVPLKSPD
jgi:hypothetical protein